MIVHIVIDDKFIDTGIDRFESVASGRNRYIAISEQRNFSFAKSRLIEKVSTERAQQIVASDDIKGVIFHSLTWPNAAILHKLSPSVKAAWIGWGFDYYSTLLRRAYPNGYYEPLTNSLVRQIKLGGGFRRNIQKQLALMKHKLIAPASRAINRFSYFIPVLQSEWELARRFNVWLRAEYLPWNYAVDGCGQPVVFPSQIAKSNILVGNSADLTNNHLDAFEAMARSIRPATYERIVVPLSYGGAEAAKRIKEAGHHYFGSKFFPVDQFYSKDEYNRLLASCHTVVMNHVRQQGLGTINQAIYLGARIVLNSRSPVCEELRRRGVAYEVLDTFDAGPLAPDLVAANRRAQAEALKHIGDPQRTLALVRALTL